MSVAFTRILAINMETWAETELCSEESSGPPDGKITSHHVSYKIKGEAYNDSDFRN